MERKKFGGMKILCVLATLLLIVKKSQAWQVDLMANLHLDYSGRSLKFLLIGKRGEVGKVVEIHKISPCIVH